MTQEAGVHGPELSVVLPTDGWETIARTVAHLRAQTARDRLELVIPASRAQDVRAHDGELGAFAQVRVLEVDVMASMPAARAAGIRAARAPIVVLSESHSFPEPGWAAALIDAHRAGWRAVGPVVVNANPGTAPAWGNFLVAYGRWAGARTAGAMRDLPGHNSSYRRSLLLAFGDALPRLLQAESLLHRELRSRGHLLYLEPAARTRHLNMTALRPAMLEWLHHGRGVAATRAAGWSLRRRAVNALGTPLIAAARLGRTLLALPRLAPLRVLPRSLPMVAACALGRGVGELAGLVAGGGRSARHVAEYELHRDRYAC